jgi:hypothetical protein
MHVAIIMDGNGRWAERRGLPRTAGHRAGARAVRRIVEAAARTSLGVLTLYAFSADNWTRPAHEVASLMRLLKRYLVSETARCLENGVRLNVIGRRDRLSADLVRTIENTEQLTSGGNGLQLRLAIDYSARESITRAAAIAGVHIIKEFGSFHPAAFWILRSTSGLYGFCPSMKAWEADQYSMKSARGMFHVSCAILKRTLPYSKREKIRILPFQIFHIADPFQVQRGISPKNIIGKMDDVRI